MVIQAFRPTVGGAELQLERLLPYLADRGVRATVVTRAHPGQPRREAIPGAEVRRTLVAGRSPAASAAFVGAALAHLARRRRHVDLVHAHGALSEGTIAIAANELGFPAVVTLLGDRLSADLARLEQKPAGRFRARALRRNVWFVALTSSIRAQLVREGVAEERIFQIPNGVDTATFRPAPSAERMRLRSPLGLGDGPVIAFAGRLIATKRVDVLVRAVADVPAVTLAVAGDGPERSRLEALARERGVSDRVSFLGFVSDTADLLRAADAFAFPSEAEGMSNALLEAMACGLPCVVAPAAAEPDVVAPATALVVPGDAEAWAVAIACLLDDRPGAEALGRSAAAFVQRRFSFDVTADATVAAYRRILDRSSRDRRSFLRGGVARARAREERARPGDPSAAERSPSELPPRV